MIKLVCGSTENKKQLVKKTRQQEVENSANINLPFLWKELAIKS
jgi:hypothetical protein